VEERRRRRERSVYGGVNYRKEQGSGDGWMTITRRNMEGDGMGAEGGRRTTGEGTTELSGSQ
jgi:hypothetical protein